MKFLDLRPNLSRGLWSMVIASSVFLAACGGSGGGGGSTQTAGIGGTGIVAGKITGFGSVYVNGDRYEIGTSQIIVDGEGNKLESDLKLGMVVRLEVETENGAFTDKAIEVVYDDEIQGPVEATPVTSPDGTQRTFDILGQMVTIDDVGTLFEDTSFGAIDTNDVLEISGFRSATGIVATYVKLESATTEAELQGEIEAPLTATTFMIGPVTVTYDGTDLAPGLILQVGQNVEVKGTFVSQSAIDATEIDLEDDDFGEEVDDISLQGIVSGFATGGISNFFIGNQNVNANGATPGFTLMDGLNIEVEGEITGGTLFADEVKLREGDSKLRAFIGTVNAPDFTVHFPVASGPTSVTVRTDSQTLFEDETGASVPPFSIDDLNPGMTDFVRVEGSEIAGNVVLATTVKRTATVVSGDPSPEDKLELEGKVDGFNFGGGNGTITVLGIEYQLQSGTTSYEPPGNPPPIAVDDFVEIEDKDEIGNRADGIADEVEEE